MSHRNAYIVLAAAEALGRLGIKESRTALEALLRREDVHVVEAAAEALGSLGYKKKARAALKVLLSHRNADVARAAAAALGAQESRAALKVLLSHRNADVVRAAARALGSLGVKESQPALAALLSHRDASIVQAAAQALYQIDPAWDLEIQTKISNYLKAYQEIVSARASDFYSTGQPQIENLIAVLEASKGAEDSELRQLIPQEEEIDLIGPTIDAAKALAAGIMAKEPVLLMGPTGVGKNAIIRWLAHRMKRPVFRVQFHKEMDEGQLLGHFTIQTIQDSSPQPQPDPLPGPLPLRERGIKKRVVFEEGRLLDAIRYGGWCVLDEINLAREGFLVSLNDLTQQIKSGVVWVKQGGKVVEVRVHEDFRLIATGNPEGYGGRKALEQSVASRWLTMKLREFRVEELQTILRKRMERGKTSPRPSPSQGEGASTVGAPLAAPKLLSEASIAMLPKILEQIKVSSGEEGLITIRTLKRVASRIEEVEGEELWEKNEDGSYKVVQVNRGENREDFEYVLSKRGWEELLRALGAEVLDGLEGEKYESAKTALKLFLIDETGMTEERLEALLNPETSEEELEQSVLSYNGSMNIHWPAKVEHCSAWEDLVSVPTTRKLAFKVLDSFRRGDYVILEGLPAVSKSAVIKWIGKLLKQEVLEVTGSGDMSISELLGVPFINEEGEIQFREGVLLEAIKRGSLLVINEANLIPPEVLERLNSLIDDERMVMVTENGAKVPVHAHPNFRLIFTQNPAGMSGGRIDLSPALINKFRRIQIRKDFNSEEKKEIVYQRLGGKERNPLPPAPPGKSGPSSPTDPVSPNTPLSSAGASLLQGAQTVAGAKNPVSDAAQAMSQGVQVQTRGAFSHQLNMALPGHILETVFTGKGKTRRSSRGEEGIEPAAVAEAEEKAEEVNALIAGMRAHEEAFMAEHGQKLERIATLAAFGHVRVEVDKTGQVDIAALDLDRKVFLINPHEAKDFSPEQLVAIALHEGGHGAISRMIDKKWFKKASLHLLGNCVEDPRVNEYELARFPGARPAFNSLYDKFFPDSAAVANAERRGKIKPLGGLPHEQFAHGILDLWANGRVTERVMNSKVKAALEKVQPILNQIWHTYPDCYYPQEKDIRAKQKGMYDLMEEHLLPLYQEFYKESLEEVEKNLQKEREQQGQEGEGSPGQAGGRSSIDREDLSEEARKILEERADKMAGALDPNNKPQRDQINKARQAGREKEEKNKDGSKVSLPAAAGEGGGGDFRPFDQRTVGDMLKQRAVQKAAERKFYENNPWRRYFDPVKNLARQTAELVKHVLKLNTDHEYVGNFYTGTKLNLKKAVEVFIRNEVGITSEEDFKLFLRKKFPTKPNHKWVLVLDQSGSMKGEEIQNSALQGMALFVYLMKELKMDYAVVGFADTADIHKSFREKVNNEKQLNALLEELQTAGGGGTNDLEGIKFAEELLSREEGDQKTVIVITDGAGVSETSDYVKQLKKKGIHTIGVGIGAGTDAVTKVYEDYYQSEDFRALPKLLLKLLVKQIFGKGKKK
ncbi:MAG: AAA family ATPase [Deltaproteobacteria bacterium]|nr:AAA family ATPase [Deltaproteobacteria bacterium]